MSSHADADKVIVLVRHGDRVVRVFLKPEEGRLRLMHLEPIKGPVPDWDHLAGELFFDEDGLRRAVEAALRGAVGDTLDLVRISDQAYLDWLALVREAAARAVAFGRSMEPSGIPDERARTLPDGSLEIYLELPWERLSLRVPPEQWAWRVQPS